MANLDKLRSHVLHSQGQARDDRIYGHPIMAIVDSTAALFWRARVIGAEISSRIRRRRPSR